VAVAVPVAVAAVAVIHAKTIAVAIFIAIANAVNRNMPPKRNGQPGIQAGKLIEGRDVYLPLGKPAVSISSSTSPSSIGTTSNRPSNITPTSLMSSAKSVTTPPSSKNASKMLYTPPTIGLKSSIAKKKLKFSPEANIGAKKHAFMINFCDRDEVKIECLKYMKHAVDLPIDQESQLTFLLNQFQARDIQASFYKLIGEVGGVASSAFIPMPSQKKKLINEFLCLIYDHKSMLINTVEHSYR
jgi:hypothetical protein